MYFENNKQCLKVDIFKSMYKKKLWNCKSTIRDYFYSGYYFYIE